MKKMNNIYAAPKAEVIELNVCRDIMQMGTGGAVGPQPTPTYQEGGSL